MLSKNRPWHWPWKAARCGLAALLASPALLADISTPSPAELVAIARLPADTLVPGPTSGQLLDPEQKATNFVGPPYPNAQPVQGISAIVDEGDGRYLALLDNGFGSKANSPDFVLSIYRIRPEFRTAEGGSGVIHIESRIVLRDPDRRLPFPRVVDAPHYPGSESIPVAPDMVQRAWLTGADLDPESLQRLEGGHYWIGDEFGPYLLHFGRSGKLLDAPFVLPGFYSEDAVMASWAAKVARSGGFEGMALDREAGVLYPMLEKALVDAQGVDAGVLEIFAFDLARKQYLPPDAPAPMMRYPLDEGAHSVGAFQYLGNGEFLTIERDRGQGATAQIKRIYRVKQGQTDVRGLLRKELLVDLLHISDPGNLSGAAVDGVYAFAFETIESLVIMGPDQLGVVNDNNFPFGNGPDGTDAEETVFVVIQVPGLRQ
jgi:hypothetical protein